MPIRTLKLSLTTFLKICSKKPRGKIGEIRRFTKGGGYDFYKRMKQIANQLAKKEISLDDAKKLVGKITAPTEQEHTLAAILKLHALLEAWNLEWVAPPEGAYTSPSGLLVVKLSPDLAFKQPDGKALCLHLWNLARPELEPLLAGEGLWLVVDELGNPDLAFGMLDLRKKTVVGEEVITSAAGPRLQLDLLRAEEIWKDLHNPALSDEQTLSHIASLSFPPAT